MKLVIEDSAGTRSTVNFTGDEITIGRAAEGNTVRLAERNVSRRHARFVRQGTSVSVEDVGSLVGTRVNGERIQARKKLRAGDVVEIGDFDVAVLDDAVVSEEGAPPPLPAPAITPARATVPAAKAVASEPQSRPTQRTHAVARVDQARTTRLAAIAGVAALALGLAAGFAVARLTGADAASSPPPAGR
jgi:pSer/pThr/pTyr-binding forkhead associated (FHA) protein